jgi:hypothetical protein
MRHQGTRVPEPPLGSENWSKDSPTSTHLTSILTLTCIYLVAKVYLHSPQARRSAIPLHYNENKTRCDRLAETYNDTMG